MDAPPMQASVGPRVGRPTRTLVLVATLALAVVAGCAKEETQSTGSGDTGFVLESYNEVGPNAFTPSVATDTTAAAGQTTSAAPPCDKKAFIKELQARPDAIREWAKVLKIPEASVPNYVDTLEPATLAVDFKVTNHGLKDGQAYPRNSILSSGTAVLVDPNFGSRTDLGGVTLPSYQIPPSTTSTSLATTTTGKSSTTVPSYGYPVTRCKCGNPLLPPTTSVTPPGSAATFPPGTNPPGTNPGTTATVRRGGGSSSSSSSSTARSSSSSSPSSSSTLPTSSSSASSSTAKPIQSTTTAQKTN